MSKAPVVPPEATPLEAFLNGQAVRAQEYLGAHPDQVDGQEGYRFRVWAPHAKAVGVMGDFKDRKSVV